MIALTLGEIASACGGVLRDADEGALARSVVIDSREATDGSLFAALPGEHADGHDFAGQAIERGAVASVVRKDIEGPRVVVDDVLAALASIAGEVRARATASCIAVTGSSGKTTTKDLIVAALYPRAVHASPASFNNEIGVPLTIMGVDGSTDVLVVEVGSRGIGHIAALMPLVKPDVSVVTNVGTAHVGMFGDIGVTAQAKGEIVESLTSDGTAVLNADDDAVRAMAERTDARVITFGRSSSADVRATDVSLDERGCARFTVEHSGDRASVHLSVVGEHMVDNAVAAIGAALALGADLADAAKGIERATAAPGRMQIREAAGRMILDDTYNANPDSVAAALKTLAALGRGRPTWAVLGEMAELGDRATEAHDQIGRLAVRLGIGKLVVVGGAAQPIHEGARLEGMFGGESHLVADIDGAMDVLTDLEPNAVVLVKASRSAGLDRIADALVGQS